MSTRLHSILSLWEKFNKEKCDVVVFIHNCVHRSCSSQCNRKLFCSVLISALVLYVPEFPHSPSQCVPGFAYLHVVVHVCGIVDCDVWGLYSGVVSPVDAAHYALPTLRLVKLCVE